MMKFLTSWILLLALLPVQGFALTNVDRQELLTKNLLADKNSGFESGIGTWTASPALVKATTTNILIGSGSATWDSTAAGQSMTSAAVTVPNGLEGRQCEVSVLTKVPSGTATHLIQAWNGTSSVYQATIIQDANNPTKPYRQVLNFPCPAAATTLAVRILSVAANEPLIAVDDGWISVASGFGNISQSYFFGGMEQAGATNCSYTENTSSSRSNYIDLGTAASCAQTWTATGPAGNVTVPAATGYTLTLNNMPAGDFEITASASMFSSVTAQTCNFQFSDGTNVFGYGTVFSGAGNITAGHVTGRQTYTTSGTRTIKIQAADDNTGSCGMADDTAGSKFIWKVFYYPTGGQLAVAANQQRTPKVTTYATAGTFTHTTSPGTTFMTVEAVGPGGGGASGGSGGTGGNAGATSGTNTSFGGTLIVANAGGGGQVNGAGVGGAYTINSPAIELFGSGTGNTGSPGNTHETNASFDYLQGGTGGSSCMGVGAGYGGAPGSAGGAATAAGSGGGGGGSYGPSPATTSSTSGGGGGAGGCAKARIDNPASSYAVVIPSAPAGGTAVGIGGAGGAAGAGKIVVTEYFSTTSLLLANSVSTSVPNGVLVQSATVTGGTTPTVSQDGSWLTFTTRTTTGDVTFGITGFTTTAPRCVITGIRSTSQPNCAWLTKSNTSIRVICRNPGDTAGIDDSFEIVCTGPK